LLLPLLLLLLSFLPLLPLLLIYAICIYISMQCMCMKTGEGRVTVRAVDGGGAVDGSRRQGPQTPLSTMRYARCEMRDASVRI
jgi:hypothetical protein